MRFASAVVALLSAGLVPASAAVLVERGQSVISGDDLKIPGDSPLELCDKDHAKDIVTIDKVDLLPNPPKAYVSLVYVAVTASQVADPHLRY